MQKIKLKNEPSLSLKCSAFDYQQAAVDFAKERDYTGIFHEQGLGKTVMGISIAVYWLEKKMVDTILFVTKKGLIQNWYDEFQKHTDIKPRILLNDQASRRNILSPCRVMLSNFEVVSSCKNLVKLFLENRNVAIIIDESAKLKNPESTIATALHELSPLFKKRVIMTGTPAANRPYDIWSQIFFLDEGKSLGTDFDKFKKDHDLTNRMHDDKELQMALQKNLERLFEKIEGFCIRETKKSSGIVLPEKHFHEIVCDWESVQYNMYKQVKNETAIYIQQNKKVVEDDSTSIVKRLLRLIQITSNPALIDEGYIGPPGKMTPLIDLVEQIVARGEKCIIWTTFIENVNWLAKELKRFGAVRVHGKLSVDDRNHSLEKFKKQPETRILIATPASAKEGLTLTVANHAIYLDRTLSLDDYLQSQDRIHRYSQTRECHVYKLIMQDSIDVWVDNLLSSKQMAAKLAQRDVDAKTFEKEMSYEFGQLIADILNAGE